MIIPECGDDVTGRVVKSASLWMDSTMRLRFDLIERAAELYPNPQRFGDGEKDPVSLMEEIGDTVKFPRHLLDAAGLSMAAIGADAYDVVDNTDELCDVYDKFDFMSRCTIQLRDNQIELYRKFGEANYGCLVAVPGKGKTELGLLKAAERGYATLILVTNTGIAEQWKDRAMRRLGLREDEIGMIQSGLHLKPRRGETPRWERPLVIAVMHNLARDPNSFPSAYRFRFGTVIADEAHHLPATMFSKVLGLFFGARFALTATPNRDDGMGNLLYALCGPVVAADLTVEFPCNIEFVGSPLVVQSDERREVTDRRWNWHLSKVHTFMAKHVLRNTFLVKLAMAERAEGRKVLVLVHSAEHPQALADLAVRMCGEVAARNGVITGETKYSERGKILSGNDLIFATLGVAAEGLDKPELDTVIFGTPFVSSRLLQQGKGRAERYLPGKETPRALIVTDPFVPFVEQYNYAMQTVVKNL